MSPIKKRFLSFKNNLTKIKDKKPLGALSLIVIIFLDIFVLTVIFQGLSDHTQQLTSSSQYVPYTCREVFVEQSWNSENEIDKLQQLVLSNSYHQKFSSNFDLKRMHTKCQEFNQNIATISKDSLLVQLFVKRRSLKQESILLNKKAAKSKAVTQNTLLTDISQGNKLNKHPAISAKNKAETEKLEQLTSKIAKLDEEIHSQQKVKAFLGVISSWDNLQRQQFIDKIASFEKWYPFRVLGWQMLFLIPLFWIFYFWNHRSIKKENGLQVLLSTHLLVVIAIPIFTKIIEVVLELIPKHFFKKLFETLSDLHLLALWHYALILLAILLAILLIYIIQKKLFNIKRLQQKRMSNSCCIECGKKLPNHDKICPFCGKKQVEDCPECKSETYIYGDFCVNCGVKKR